MFVKTMKNAALVAMIVILAGCSTATPAPAEPTPDSAATLNALTTQAAQTVVAGLTQNAPTVTNTPEPTATEAATNTPEPTATQAFTPTNTPVPPTPTLAFIPWTATPTPTQAAFSCTYSVSPATNAEIKKGADFDAKWSIKNTGTESWGPDADIRFSEGDKLRAGADIYDMPEEIEPGETLTFITDMKAPTDQGTGTFDETWIIIGEGGIYCTFKIQIKVVD